MIKSPGSTNGGGKLRVISENVREGSREQKRFQTLTEGRQRWEHGADGDYIVRQTVPDGGSGDWEGPVADGRQLDGRHQQTIGPSREEGTPTRQIGDTNQCQEFSVVG